MEHELLGRFKDYLNFTFANNFIGTKSLDQIADTVENSAPAKVLIELYPVMGKTLIRILLSQKIRDYIDAAEYRRTT